MELDMSRLTSLKQEVSEKTEELHGSMESENWNDQVSESYQLFVRQIMNLQEDLQEKLAKTISLNEKLASVNTEELEAEASELCSAIMSL